MIRVILTGRTVPDQRRDHLEIASLPATGREKGQSARNSWAQSPASTFRNNFKSLRNRRQDTRT